MASLVVKTTSLPTSDMKLPPVFQDCPRFYDYKSTIHAKELFFLRGGGRLITIRNYELIFVSKGLLENGQFQIYGQILAKMENVCTFCLNECFKPMKDQALS